jgi:tetratricopeptide (TPR) repeat protein
MKNFFSEKIVPHAVPAGILFVFTFTVYMRTLGHDFQLFWDDAKYVTSNEVVQGFTLEHLKGAFTGYYVGNYAPVQIISYMADNAVWGMRASGFFLTNILLHLGNGLLFYVILIRLGWRRLWAFLSAFVFLLHPVQVESVAWISERKNLLAMFFCLLAFALYLSYREKGWEEGKRAYLSSFTSFLLALLAKSVAVIFPLQILLYDLCYPERRERGRWLTDKIPFLCAAAVIAWIAMRSQLPGEAPGMGGGRTSYHGGSPYATFLTMLTVLARYVKLLVWPSGLSAVYDPPIKTGIDGAVAAGGFLFVLLMAGGVLLFRRRRRLFFWYALFFVGLLPVSQVVPIITLMNDRYLYFPMLGAAACFGGLASCCDACSGARRAIALAAAGLFLVALPCLSFARAGVWKNDLTLWSDAAEKTSGSAIAVYGLAQALQNSGDLDAALPVYLRVLAIDPRHMDTLNNLGALYRAKNLPLKGRPYLLDLTRYYPAYAKGFLALGLNYDLTGDLGEAEKAFRRALALQPRSKEVLLDLARISYKTKRLDAARNYLRDAAAFGGTNADIEYNRACIEALTGHHRESLQFLESAFRLGFRNRENVEKDSDLAAIRSLPDFQRLVSSYFGEGGGQTH